MNEWLMAHNYDPRLGLIVVGALVAIVVLFGATLWADAHLARVKRRAEAAQLHRAWRRARPIDPFDLENPRVLEQRGAFDDPHPYRQRL